MRLKISKMTARGAEQLLVLEVTFLLAKQRPWLAKGYRVLCRPTYHEGQGDKIPVRMKMKIVIDTK